MASTPVINIRRGQAVRHNGDVCIVSGTELKTPPRMASYVQMTIRSLASDKVHNLRMTSNESMDSVVLNKEDYEYSYKDGDGFHFLHPETYEDVLIGEKIVAPVKDYLIEGQKYVVVFTDDAVAAIELPAAMSMITEPGFMLATISSVISVGAARPGISAVEMTISAWATRLATSTFWRSSQLAGMGLA